MKKFRDFESAREFVRNLGIKSRDKWNEYCKSGKKPDDIPSAPWLKYKKDFKGTGDWLGTGKIVPTKSEMWSSYDDAKIFVISLNLKIGKEWNEYCKSGKKPDYIPSHPATAYKKDFKGMGDWLGTGKVSVINRQFRPFKEAREFARNLGIKSRKEWDEYCKSGNKPDDIPITPNNTYKKEWDGWKNWNTDITDLSNIHQFRPFKEAREFTRNLGIKSRKEWDEYCKSGNKPDDIPDNPEIVYKKEWYRFIDFFGFAPPQSIHQFRPFKEAREFVKTLNLKGDREWREYCKSGNKPDDIPTNPVAIYEEFAGLGDWLGTGNVNSATKQFRPFKEAREFVRSLNLKGFKKWQEYCKSGNKPDGIPKAPWGTYAEEWIGLSDWLGTGRSATFNKQFRPFKEAREFVRSLNLKNNAEWREYCKSGNKPDDIPWNPQKIYAERKKK